MSACKEQLKHSHRILKKLAKDYRETLVDVRNQGAGIKDDYLDWLKAIEVYAGMRDDQ